MPTIKIKHVVSVSSEDKNYPADNLLKTDGYKKWKSGSVGEKQLSVTLQFEKAAMIEQIDIGNDGSAFVEVLVGNSCSTDDFQVLLVASSFMSPAESRNGQNSNRVRMFGAEKMNNITVKQKWDRVKVVCTQPFCKTAAYGLSFVTFHSPEDPNSKKAPIKQATIGMFQVKAETEDEIRPGSLFANRKKEKSPPPLTGAAAMRAASRLADEAMATSTSKVKEEQVRTVSPAAPKRKISEETHEQNGDTEHKRIPLKKQSTSLSSVRSASSSRSKDSEPILKKSATMPTHKKSTKPFHKLMDRVVFVMSGYQNPERGKIRDRALEMGAQYKADWGSTCTHLICAFPNTPKYNQVRGRGRIVDKDWIKACYKKRELLPWRNYRLGKAKSPPPTSSESEDDEPPAKQKLHNKDVPVKVVTPDKCEQTPEIYNDSTDDMSAEDTDDEIRRAIDQNKKTTDETKSSTSAAAVSHTADDDDPLYDAPTDDESDMEVEAEIAADLNELPDLFKSKHFLLFGDFSSTDRHTLRRYIRAYSGYLDEYMGESTNIVVTASDWDKNFDAALSDNPDLIFVKPDWVYDCDEKQKYLPTQKYNVVP